MVETAVALEHLAEVAALERSPRQRRMLVIVNPYATTMSDRVKNLVVYALQGRYDVQAVDTQAKGHAIELCREAAHEGYDVVVAFGGDGTRHRVYKRFFRGADLAAELGGGEVLHDGAWFTVVSATASRGA